MDFRHLEEQRQALETNLAALRKSLKYWQTFEAEYEGLKEELRATKSPLDAEALHALATSYAGELVDEKVVLELAGLPGTPHASGRIVRDIERRQEYVQKNLETLQSRFFVAEAKLEELDFASSRSSSAAAEEEEGGEDGLPLTEIHEELDDEGNVIASRLEQPELKQGKLLESLRKAGLTKEDLEGLSEGDVREMGAAKLKPAMKDGPGSAHRSATQHPIDTALAVEKRGKSTSSPDSAVSNDATLAEIGGARPPTRKKSVSFTADTKAPPEIVRLDACDEGGEKRVSFAEKVAIAPAAPLPDMRTVQFSPTIEEIPEVPGAEDASLSQDAPTPTKIEDPAQKELRQSMFKPGDKVLQLGDDDEVVAKHIVVPENESPEDAQMRREMLDYHLNEVGHVVAQMDLDDYGSDDEDEDDDDDASSHVTGSTYVEDQDTPYTSGGVSDSEGEEEEDAFGRTKKRVVSEDYKRQMQEMEARLIGNIGRLPADTDLADIDMERDAVLDPMHARRLVIRGKRESTSSMSSADAGAAADDEAAAPSVSEEVKPGTKKRVSFAQGVEVEPGSPPLKARRLDPENAVPVADTIAERLPAPTTTTAATKKKTSKFKQSRAPPPPEDESGTPTGPADRVLADTLVEREARAQSSQNLDNSAALERRELAREFYQQRNDLVKQQGGFKVSREEEDGEVGELYEEREDGRVRKVSLFRKARIGGGEGG